MTLKRSNAPHMLALALTMTGCEYIGPQLHEKMPLPATTSIQDEQAVLPEAKDTTPKTAKVELFLSEDSSSIHPQPSATDVGEKAGGKGEYSLNFDDADLGEVAKVILSDILHKNYTLSPQVTGKVTLQTTKPLSKEELIPTLEMLLSVNDAALVTQGSMYLIKPSHEAVYSSSIKSLGVGRMASGYQSRIIPIRNVAAGEIAEILKPLLPEKALLQADSNHNILLVAGSGSDISRIMDVVNTFDVDVLKGRSFALFTPAHADASKIIDELDAIFNHKQSGEKSEKGVSGSFFRFIEIERLNAILAITQNGKYLHDIENWVMRLDRTNADAGGGVNVYRAQHVSALELADTLNDIFGSGIQRSSRSASIASGRKSMSASNRKDGTGSSSKKDSLMDKSLSDNKTQDKTTNRSASTGSSNAEMPNVKIIADEGNNALIIVSNSEEYAKIQKVIKQLDVLPLQVLIDATIVEVALNDDLEYGIQWYLTHQNGGNNILTGGANSGLVNKATDGSGVALTEIAKAVGTGGLSYAFSSRSGDINAILKAGATNNNINVISSPSLMVLNNQEASIKVGDSVPTRSSVSNNLNNAGGNNGGVLQTSSIQMTDTGVNLQVKPRVNAGGLVLMDILQSVSDPKVTTTSDGIDSPTIQVREIQTNVVVQSGETIVLGGLIKENNTDNHFGVPLLHEIPLLGPLFGSTTRNKDKTELVVLITPRVVSSRMDAQSITDEFRRKLSAIYEVPEEIAVEEEVVN